MTLTTDKGKTFDVDWAWAPVGDDEDLMFELASDTRPLSEIAADFEGCTSFHRTSTTELPEEADYNGYTQIRSIVRKRHGRVQLTMMKGA